MRRARGLVSQPREPNLPCLVRQCPIFYGIRRQLMQSHGQRKSKPRRDLDLWSSDLETGLTHDAVGFENLLDHIPQPRALPALPGQDIVRP